MQNARRLTLSGGGGGGAKQIGPAIFPFCSTPPPPPPFSGINDWSLAISIRRYDKYLHVSCGHSLHSHMALDPLNRPGDMAISSISLELHGPYGQRHGTQKDSDMGHGYFLNLTRDKGNCSQQRQATFPSLKIDMRQPDPPPSPVKGPLRLVLT